MRTSSELATLAAAVKAAPDLDEEQQRIAVEVYRRLAEGSPAPVSEIAQRAGATTERTEQLLGSRPGVFFDDSARVVGFWGLTIGKLSPTHRLLTNGHELFGWCAWDTLFLPGILGRTVEVQSVCPTTNQEISLVVSPSAVIESSHPDAVVSFLIPDRDFDADVIQNFCHFIYFFASPEAGRSWSESHPGTFLLSLQDAFELGRQVNELNFGSTLGGGR